MASIHMPSYSRFSFMYFLLKKLSQDTESLHKTDAADTQWSRAGGDFAFAEKWKMPCKAEHAAGKLSYRILRERSNR